ncbi:MAG: hypothetical protein IT372_33770 [Polyangiaceae bacterium]|nr:hypothetical protein [Polyangiaceae bacterium]
MRRPALIAAAAALVALGAIGACTQDFNQFEPDGNTTTGTTTSSTSTTSTGTGGSGGDTTTTTTTPSGQEDCINGADDDGDGDIDCADSDCGGFSCVDPATNWEGPGLLYDGPAGGVPDCPPAFPDIIFEGLGDPVQQDATCSACTCSAPTVTCTPAPLVARGNANCGGNSTNLTQPTSNNTCQAVSPSGTPVSFEAAAPGVNATDCNASGGAPTIPPPQAGALGRLCGATLSGAGCGAQGEVCVPNDVGSPFVGKVCVWRTGDHSCPAGFPDRHEFSDALDDTRGCSPCACGNPNATCTITTTLYSDGNCTNQIDMVPNDGTCVNAAEPASIMINRTTTGSCPPSGGEPIGGVALGPNTTTICCAQ